MRYKDPHPLLDLGVLLHRLGVATNGGDRRLVGEHVGVLADDFLRRAPGQPLHGSADEAEGTVLVGRPDHVRAVVDQEPIALLGLLEVVIEAGVGQRHRRLVGEELQDLGVLRIERGVPNRLDRDRAQQPIRADERRGHHRLHALVADALIALVVRERRVGEVVVGPDDAPLLGCHACHARADRNDDVLVRRRRRCRGDGPVEGPAAIAHEIDLCPVGAQQPRSSGHGALDDARRVVERGHLRRDRRQGALCLDSVAQLVVEAGVDRGDRGLSGERLHQLGIRFLERVAPAREDGDGPQRSLLAGERRRHLGAEAVLAHECVGVDGVLEGVIGQVVAGPHHAPLRNGAATEPLADVEERLLADHLRLAIKIPDRGAEAVRAIVEQVDDCRIAAQQAPRLVDGSLVHRVRLANRGDLRRDLGQRSLRLDATGERLGTRLHLAVQARV